MKCCIAVSIEANDIGVLREICMDDDKRSLKITFSSQVFARQDLPDFKETLIRIQMSNSPQPFYLVEGKFCSFAADNKFQQILEHCKLWSAPRSAHGALDGFAVRDKELEIYVLGNDNEGGLLFVIGESAETYLQSSFPRWKTCALGIWSDTGLNCSLRLAQSALIIRRALDSSSVESFDNAVSRFRKYFLV
jgi:hypothetical protein